MAKKIRIKELKKFMEVYPCLDEEDIADVFGIELQVLEEIIEKHEELKELRRMSKYL